jgi:tetratricopeptide (TPR) repeat protein
MRYAFVILLLFALQLVASAQDLTNLAIDGLVKDEDGGRLTGAKIALYQDGKQINTQTSERSGRFEFFLEFDHEFTIKVSKAGYVDKIIYINTNGVPEDEQAFGYEWPITVELFKRMDGVDYSMLEKPIGKIYYEANVQNFVGDNAYLRLIKDELKRLEDAQKAAIKSAAQQLARSDEDFQLAIQDAQLAIKDGDYLTAKDNLLAANALKPGSPEVQNLLNQVNQKLEAEGAKEDQYLSALASADQAFGSGKWQEAIASYNQALSLKPNEQYPKDRIAKSQELMAKMKEAEEAANVKAAQERQYNELITKADNAFNSKNYRDAKTYYQNALGIKNETYPKERIVLADQMISKEAELAQEEKALQALEVRYAERIDKANTAFSGGNYENAKTLYNEAAELKPNETYPKDQLAKIDAKLAELEAARAKQLEAEQQSQLFAQYIREGEKSLRDGQLDAAENFFNQALALKPSEPITKQRLAEVEQARAARIKLAEEQKNREALEQSYQTFVKAGDLDFNEKEYESAIANYKEALAVKPREIYPDAQIKKAEQALANAKKQLENQAAFEKLIADGDDKMSSQSFESAISLYRDALKLNPENASASKKLKSAEDALQNLINKNKEQEAQLAQEKLFNALVLEGDNALNAQNFALAINKYQSALNIKKDPKVSDQLEKARTMQTESAEASNQLAKETERKRQYQLNIEKAQLEMKAKDYQSAKETFNLAGTFAMDEQDHIQGLQRLAVLIAEEEAEKERLKAIEEEKVQEQAKRENFNKLVKEGNEALLSKDLVVAKDKFLMAQELFPEDPTPKDKLKIIEDLERERKVQEEKAAFDQIVAEADKAFLEKNWDAALSKYESALNLNSSSGYVQDRAKKCRELIAQRDKTPEVTEVDSHRRVVEETYDEGRTKVTVRRVIVDGKELVYKRVVHSWGGKYYFLDDQPITELVWNRETVK